MHPPHTGTQPPSLPSPDSLLPGGTSCGGTSDQFQKSMDAPCECSGQRGKRGQGLSWGHLGTLESGPQPLLPSDPGVQAFRSLLPQDPGILVSPVFLRLGERDLSPHLPLTQESGPPDLQSPVHGLPLAGFSVPGQGSQPHFIPCTPSPGEPGQGGIFRDVRAGGRSRVELQGRGAGPSPPNPRPAHTSGMAACLLIATAVGLQG